MIRQTTSEHLYYPGGDADLRRAVGAPVSWEDTTGITRAATLVAVGGPHADGGLAVWIDAPILPHEVDPPTETDEDDIPLPEHCPACRGQRYVTVHPGVAATCAYCRGTGLARP